MTKSDARNIRRAWQRLDKATAYNNKAFDPAKLEAAKTDYLNLLESLGVPVGDLRGRWDKGNDPSIPNLQLCNGHFMAAPAAQRPVETDSTP